MNRVAVFGGTFEGRVISEHLARAGAAVSAFVATPYGRDLLPIHENISVSSRRLDSGEMTEAVKSGDFHYIVDATHPYADEATANIQTAANQANAPYLRIKRDDCSHNGAIQAKTADEAARRLKQINGNILLTTGTETLHVFADAIDCKERVFIRTIPDAGAIDKCIGLGFKKSNLICMQGPFSYEVNVATIKMHDISALVTKDSGDAGGFPEKRSAAKACDVTLVVIVRPDEISDGVSVEAAMDMLAERLNLVMQKPHAPKPDLSGKSALRSDMETSAAYPRFPIFIPLENKEVLVVGGGKVAARRARSLIDFGASVIVISPEICMEMQEFADRIIWKQERFSNIDRDFSLVLAATDDRKTNRWIGENAKMLGIPVSVADKKEESTFWFPAIVKGDGIVAGLISESADHGAVREAAKKVRNELLN